MSQEITVKCDGCGKIKGASNHWFVLFVRDKNFSNFFVNESFIKKDLCGQACLLELIAQLVNKKEGNPCNVPNVESMTKVIYPYA